jgi:acyl-CoA synthetase (AMP-forming)/AMP-acid ligase II
VAACAAIGLPDSDRGERLLSVVLLKAGQQAAADHIRNHCKALIGVEPGAEVCCTWMPRRCGRWGVWSEEARRWPDE